MFQNDADAVHVQNVEIECVFDRVLQFGDRGVLQQEQDPDELAGTEAVWIAFQPTTQQVETRRQVPILQGSGVIQTARLLLQ